MLRIFRMYWTIVTKVGRSLKLGKQIDAFFRYYVLDSLRQQGFFEYLNEPRTYGQILANFGYIDSDYTRMVFDVLVKDKNALVLLENDLYRINPDTSFPNLDNITDTANSRIQSFSLMAKGMARYVLARMKNETIELSETFEEDGRQLMTKFDKTLGGKVYTGLRQATFDLVTKEDYDQHLIGKKLLEVGCGSGRETAELWLRLNGNVHLTATDPIASMLELAKDNFENYLNELDPNHPKVEDKFYPIFEQVSATALPYEDASFDAVFCGFVLHWTPNPQKAIQEIARVLKPGGLVLGIQPTRPAANAYFDLVVRASQNSYGFFWGEELYRWFNEQRIDIERYTPVNIFRGHKLR